VHQIETKNTTKNIIVTWHKSCLFCCKEKTLIRNPIHRLFENTVRNTKLKDVCFFHSQHDVYPRAKFCNNNQGRIAHNRIITTQLRSKTVNTLYSYATRQYRNVQLPCDPSIDPRYRMSKI